MLMLQMQLLLLIMIGFGLSKVGTITPQGRKSLSDLLINFILPCNIVKSFQIDMSMDVLVSCAAMLLISIGAQMFYLAVSKVIYPKAKGDQLACLRYGTVCSNAGFLGMPVVEGIFGSMGLLLTSVALIPQRIVMWSAGLALYAHEPGKDVLKKLVKHPCIVAVYVGFALMLIGKPVMPTFVQKTIDCSSASMLCVSMLAIGGILAEAGRVNFKDPMVLWYSFVRLLLIPLLMFAVLSLLHVDKTVMGTMVILSGMPAGSITAVLASKYDCDAAFASCMVFVSTVLSIGTLPILCLLL